jgi:hypothetical protein
MKTNSARVLLSTAAVLAAAAGASAQCDWYVHKVPDFDQRRLQTPSVPGLPGNGSMYCVPTSCTNWLAYLSNHGFPLIMAGPRYWQSDNNYNWVTNRDAFMGNLMGTDPVTGTGGDGWVAGLAGYLMATAPFQFDVSGDFSHGSHAPTTTSIFIQHTLGGMMTMSYGFYTEDAPGFYTRTGGHITSVVGMQHLCDQTLTELWYRDPADVPADTTQSPFALAKEQVVLEPVHVRGASAQTYESRSMYLFWQLSGYCFLDGVVTIWPTCGLGVSGGPDTDMLQLLRPVHVAGDGIPTVQTYPTPTGGPILDVALHPLRTSFFYITGAHGASPAQVFRVDPVSGQSTPVGNYINPTRLAFSRQGLLFVLANDTIFQGDPDVPSSTGPISAPALGVTSLVYDDRIDLLVGVNPVTRVVHQWPVGLGNVFTLQLPPDPCLDGRLSLAISPADGSLWIGGQSCDALYKIVGGGTAGLSVADMVPLAPGANPTGLNISRTGHVLFTSNGQLVEMDKSSGAWLPTPGSSYAGLAASGPFELSQSRSNFDPATMTGPGYANLANPPLPNETLDCYANCDDSTVPPLLNVNDFICFQAMFAANDPQANCDESTTQPVLTVNDFICFQGKFAAGCP